MIMRKRKGNLKGRSANRPRERLKFQNFLSHGSRVTKFRP